MVCPQTVFFRNDGPSFVCVVGFESAKFVYLSSLQHGGSSAPGKPSRFWCTIHCSRLSALFLYLIRHPHDGLLTMKGLHAIFAKLNSVSFSADTTAAVVGRYVSLLPSAYQLRGRGSLVIV